MVEHLNNKTLYIFLFHNYYQHEVLAKFRKGVVLILSFRVKDHVNFTKLEFVALDVAGKNYLSWITDAKIHLDAMTLKDTIKDDNQASQ